MQVLRRRLTLGTGLALVIVAVLSLVKPADHAVNEITLPLRHDDIIRQQAADKQVDPSLIAGIELRGPHLVITNSWKADLDRILGEVSHGN